MRFDKSRYFMKWRLQIICIKQMWFGTTPWTRCLCWCVSRAFVAQFHSTEVNRAKLHSLRKTLWNTLPPLQTHISEQTAERGLVIVHRGVAKPIQVSDPCELNATDIGRVCWSCWMSAGGVGWRPCHRRLLHDGSVDDGLDIVASVPGVDHSLSLALLDLLLSKHAIKTHVWCLRLNHTKTVH